MSKNRENDNINLTYFFAEWCDPCHIQDSIIDELKKKFGEKVNIKKIDVDNTDEDTMVLTSRYSVHAIPTMIFEKNGKVYRKYVGVTNENILTRVVEEIICNA